MLGAFLTLLAVLLRPSAGRGPRAAADGLLVCFQPLFEAATGAVAGAEAIPRRVMPAGGLSARPPHMDAPALEAALRQARGWHARVALPLDVGIADADPTLFDAYDALCSSRDVPALELRLQLHEADAMRAPDRATAFARECRRRSIPFGIGSFGIAPVDLRALERIAPDFVKLHPGLVETAVADAAGRGAAAAAIAVLHALAIEVAASGVSHPAQMPWLVEQGVRTLQGYFLAPPMTAPDLADWLQARGVRAAAPQGARSAASTELRAEA